jgi:hypothetical protein
VLLFMPRGLGPWMRDRMEVVCPRCKQRNGAWRRACRLCGVGLSGRKKLQAEVAGAKGFVGHQ